MGKLRQQWREHLELGSDDELVEVLRPLRVWAGAPNYARLQEDLETKLPSVGLRVTNGDGAQSPYEQLIWNLNKEETYYFDPASLRGECKRAGLTVDLPDPESRRPKVGVRSFKRPGIDLADTADELLSLLEFFDGRFLLPEHSWRTVREQLEPFFTSIIAKHNAFDLQIDTHASLAFASGSLLQPKVGLDVNVLQFSRSGMEPWSTATASSTTQPDLAAEDVSVGNGPGVALALAITHDIVEEVRQHIAEAGLPIGRILVVRPTAGSGQAAIRDGGHALAIADEVSRLVKQRAPEERKGQLHLFAAAPNGLVFFLGQLAGSFGAVTLYEYDFEQTRSGSYEPSFSLPMPPSP